VVTDGAIDIAILNLGPRFRIYSLNVEQITFIKLLFIYSGSHSQSFALPPQGKVTAVTIGEETERAQEQVCVIQKSKPIFRVSQPVAHLQY
jgi:hypothetical protein